MIKVKIVPSGKGLPVPPRSKFLVRDELMFAEFAARLRVREYIKLKPSQTVFFIVNKTLPAATQSMGDLWKLAGEPDIMEIKYELENVFG